MFACSNQIKSGYSRQIIAWFDCLLGEERQAWLVEFEGDLVLRGLLAAVRTVVLVVLKDLTLAVEVVNGCTPFLLTLVKLALSDMYITE